jgi:hypothetical protein
MSKDPDKPWPPRAGELLPRAAKASGVRHKLATYSLDTGHVVGGPKARGFARILGITVDDVDYLSGVIRMGVLTVPVSAVRDNAPYGVKCVVDLSVRGLGIKHERTIDVRTVWALEDSAAAPRLISAYLKP